MPDSQRRAADVIALDSLEMAIAYGVRELGTALVVASGFAGFRDEGCNELLFDHCRRIGVDYQSGTKLPHSIGSAD
jgi:hypothetical protein